MPSLPFPRTVYFGPRGEDLTHYLQFYLRIPAGIVQTSTRANLLLDMVQSFETGRPIAEEELTTVPSSRSLKSSVEGAQRTEEAATQANPGSAESEDGVPSLSVVYSKGRSRSVKVPGDFRLTFDTHNNFGGAIVVLVSINQDKDHS